MQQLASPQAASGTGWISPLKSESARVMHLLRRTSFGYSPAQLEVAEAALAACLKLEREADGKNPH